MAPPATKPGAPTPKSPAVRKRAGRKPHDRVKSRATNGGSAATGKSERSNRAATKGGSPPPRGDGKRPGADPRAGAGARRASSAGKSAGRAAGKGAAKPAGNLLALTSPVGATSPKTLAAIARRSARRAAGTLTSKAIPAGASTARKVAAWAGESSGEAIMGHARRLPIQQAVDVAVPLQVAWDQWMRFNHFSEGTRRVKDVQRDGDRLVGRVARLEADEWEAEIIDERVDESFAWQSIDGSDCAGLVTFHRLSDRLTRIELNLDVRPIRLAEALALTLHLADRRAKADLRGFKVHVELLSPDTYQEIVDEANTNGRDDGPDEAESAPDVAEDGESKQGSSLP